MKISLYLFQSEPPRLDKDDFEIVQKTASEIIKKADKRENNSISSSQNKKAKIDVNNNDGNESGHDAEANDTTPSDKNAAENNAVIKY